MSNNRELYGLIRRLPVKNLTRTGYYGVEVSSFLMQRFGAIVLLTVVLSGCSPAAAQAPATPATGKTTQVKSVAPKIPHKIKEGMVCKTCHASGTNGAPVSPHPDRANCTSCHQPK